MKLILIFGPQAVGKMTVGQELSKITDLKLFHNHMTIELVAPLFGYGSESPVGSRLVNLFRKEIFEAFAGTEQYGMIFTYVWAFDQESDWNNVKETCHIFSSKGAEIYFVELEADLDERLKRNQTPNRLEHKPSKRNTARSEYYLLESMKNYRLNSLPGEIKEKNYLKIDNTDMSAEDAAKQVKEEFGL